MGCDFFFELRRGILYLEKIKILEWKEFTITIYRVKKFFDNIEKMCVTKKGKGKTKFGYIEWKYRKRNIGFRYAEFLHFNIAILHFFFFIIVVK